MITQINRAKVLKQALCKFVFDAEGDLAIAMEQYIAKQLLRSAKGHHQGSANSDLLFDRFLTRGQVNGKTPLDLWIEQLPDLPASDRLFLEQWHRNFTGLFVVEQVEADRFLLMNWLTAKYYIVRSPSLESSELLTRLKVGEILVTRLAPLAEAEWIFFSQLKLLGKLGKPKLAVAIGHFKQQYTEDLYGDAPELLEAAWDSVANYHQDFITFFGASEINLTGAEVSPRLKLFQDYVTNQYLSNTGLDSEKSLQQLANEAGVETDELAEIASEFGGDVKMVEQVISGKLKDMAKPAMALPQMQLPDRIQKADTVLILSHPRWGQIMIPNYAQFQHDLLSEATERSPQFERRLLQYLEDTTIPAYFWYYLAEHYPTQLELALATTLNQPDFAIATDLPLVLQHYQKALEPELPETASVPIHLHNLFQEALQEVRKSKPKSSGTKAKPVVGFQR